MARVTVEDCLARVPNRFALTLLGCRRARMLVEGRGRRLVECDNKDAVAALREIEDGLVRFNEDVNDVVHDFIEDQRRQLRVTTGEHTFLEAASLRALEGDDEEVDAETEEEVVEELPSDPELLHKKVAAAEGGVEEAGGDDEGDDETAGFSTTDDDGASEAGGDAGEGDEEELDDEDEDE
jgi:DNA-directed RNA polymerase subunit omega